MTSFRTCRVTAAVVSTLLLATLAGCGGGGGGGGTSTPPPTSNNPNPNPPTTTPDPDPTPLTRLTLSGTVTDAPIANAVVTATIGNQTFTANADANGTYNVEIAIDPAQASGFVTLSARGVGSQSYVEFTSLAGTFASLKTQAGADNTLSNTENFATQITNVSTALAVLLKEASGGSSIASEEVLRTLSATLDSQELLDLATAIKLYVDHSDDYPMPQGETSLLALMSSAATRAQFIDDTYNRNPTMFANAQTSIVTDSTLTQPVNADALPEKLTLAMLSNDAEFSFNYFNRVNSYTFNANGTGTAAAGSWKGVDMTWAVNGSSVDITYGETVQFDSYVRCPGVARQVAATFASEGAKLTLLNDRVVALTETHEITYPAICNLSPRTETTTVARTILEDDDFQQIDAADLAGSVRSIYVYNPSTGVTADIAELNADGTGLTWAFDKQFTWALDSSGRVVTVTFTDGSVAKFRSLRDVDALTTDLLYEFTTPDGRYVDAGASVFADPELPLLFTPQNVTGRFYQFGLGDEITRDSRLKGFRLRFNNDGTGSQENDSIVADQVATLDGTNTPEFNFRWSIDDSDDVVIQHTVHVGVGFDNCAFGSNLDCVLIDERRLVPLAVMDGAAGRRAYWMEYRRTAGEAPDVVDDDTVPTTLIRFYDYEQLSAPVVVNGKPSLAGQASTRKLRFHGISQR